ncbi:hypothetical protein CC86DRAFT_15398 [Ophiobolus disseminans]|uniref:Uncharacterized protein n=1 Tax=Ophiobolus disseminans TaxID=1469910 RepID=A0A6A7AKL3_9PLEO|nr:hypothetical protein CC86DRAFT_15398 [Ophiobolus disseminans]
MFKAIMSGVLDDRLSISDIRGNCPTEACKWDRYTTLAVCATTEEVSSKIERRKDAREINRFQISGTPWEPPTQTTNVPDTFWMTAPYSDASKVRNETLPPISDIYLAHFPACNEQKQSWGNWGKERDTASSWKAYKDGIRSLHRPAP